MHIIFASWMIVDVDVRYPGIGSTLRLFRFLVGMVGLAQSIIVIDMSSEFLAWLSRR